MTEIHQAYAAAGAEVIKTHTFGANRVRLAEYGLADKVRDLNFKAVRLVRDVREVTRQAASLSPATSARWASGCSPTVR